MSEVSHPATVATSETATGDPPLHPLVKGLRERHAQLSARDGRARPFELRLPDRTAHLIGGAIGGGGEPAFTVRIVTEKGLAAMAAFDELAVAEAYMDGDLDIEGNLLTALKHRPVLGDPHPIKYLFATYLEPLLGEVGRDKKWIKSHYDVDPEFFLLWLDGKLRAYSHGFFENGGESLEAGMERKFRYAFDACGIQPGQRVLDIGGGWSFLQFAGEQGVHVTSITISDESERTMRDLIRRRGLASCEVVKAHFLEYRPPRTAEPFDAIVNLGVTEHLPDYRRTLAQYERLLKPGRRVYLDAYSGRKHGMPSFISKWVFQGNTSPLCLAKYLAELARTPFEDVVIKNDRHNYFLSCKKWAENLEAKRDEVIARWGQHLYRRFVLYLWFVANSFENGTLSAHHMILQLASPGSAPRGGPGVLVVSEETATVDAFAVAPYAPREVRFHAMGAVLNGGIALSGLIWVLVAWQKAAPAWPWVLLAVFAGIYTADLVSGLLHWAFDTWFDEDITFLRRMVLQVREHHVYPNRIFHISFLHDAGTLSWIALVLTAPPILWAILSGAGPAAGYAILTVVIFDVLLVTMLAFHKCGHRARQPLWIRLLQRSGLLLSTHHHSQHHLGNHDHNYCIINGWADQTLGRLGLFRGLEWVIARWSGAQPQRNDHEWLRRFGRRIVGRKA